MAAPARRLRRREDPRLDGATDAPALVAEAVVCDIPTPPHDAGPELVPAAPLGARAVGPPRIPTTPSGAIPVGEVAIVFRSLCYFSSRSVAPPSVYARK